MHDIPSGSNIVNLELATAESWRDNQTGENNYEPEWHCMVPFSKLADVAED